MARTISSYVCVYLYFVLTFSRSENGGGGQNLSSWHDINIEEGGRMKRTRKFQRRDWRKDDDVTTQQHTKGLDWSVAVTFSRYSYNLNLNIPGYKPHYIKYTIYTYERQELEGKWRRLLSTWKMFLRDDVWTAPCSLHRTFSYYFMLIKVLIAGHGSRAV
jgi:hypothetical protein